MSFQTSVTPSITVSELLRQHIDPEWPPETSRQDPRCVRTNGACAWRGGIAAVRIAPCSRDESPSTQLGSRETPGTPQKLHSDRPLGWVGITANGEYTCPTRN